jgi:hypothetical protein
MKKNYYLNIAFMISSIFIFSFNAFAQQNHAPIGQGGAGSWRLLGERVIDYKAEKDLITVIGSEYFRKLKFKILDAPVYMNDMKVMFENKEIQNVPLNFRMEQGHESRVIDLPGNKRRIKVVYFNYKSARPGYHGKAKLILFGQK